LSCAFPDGREKISFRPDGHALGVEKVIYINRLFENLHSCRQRNSTLQNACGSGLAGESGGIILFHVYLTLIEFIKTPGQLQRE